MDSSNPSICFRKGNSGEVETFYDLFQEGVKCTEECDIWPGKEKRHKYLYLTKCYSFYLTLNSAQQKVIQVLKAVTMKKKRAIRKKSKKNKKCQSSTKGTKISYEKLLLHILRQKK
jgi:hypothetical protein